MKASAWWLSLALHGVAGGALVFFAHGALEVHQPRLALRHLVVASRPEERPELPKPPSTPRQPVAQAPIVQTLVPTAAPVAVEPPASVAVAEPEAGVPVAQPTEGSKRPDDVTVVPAAMVAFQKPKYPSRLRSLGVEGSVVLEVTVVKAGTLGGVRVVRSSGYPEMDSRAVDALRNASYSPGLVGSVPQDTTLVVTVRYKLE